MSAFNKVILLGNLTRDPEMKYTPKGTAVAKVGLAVNRKWRSESGEQKEEVTFIDVDMFGKTAENVAQYMRKGSSLLVEGRLKLDQWDDKQTGQKRSKLGVVAESVQFIGGKRDAVPAQREADELPRANRPATGGDPASGDPPMPEDDVPF